MKNTFDLCTHHIRLLYADTICTWFTLNSCTKRLKLSFGTEKTPPQRILNFLDGKPACRLHRMIPKNRFRGESAKRKGGDPASNRCSYLALLVTFFKAKLKFPSNYTPFLR